MGMGSVLYFSFLMFRVPSQVYSFPWRALRAGMTQSKKSTPRATASMMLEGVPTPIRYRGLSLGMWGSTASMMSYMVWVGSPTRQAADGVAVAVDLGDLLHVPHPQVGVNAPLVDAEEHLVRVDRVGQAVEPVVLCLATAPATAASARRRASRTPG